MPNRIFPHAIYLLLAGSHLKNSFVSTQFFFAVNGENLFQKTLLPPLTIKYIGLHSLKILADNKDFVAYDPFKATAASYNRTINNTWATLCLPFEVSLDNQNFRAFELGSVSNNEVVLKELNTIIAAGTPVIIKMNEGETKLNFTEADKEIANEVKTAATADGNYQLKGLYTQKLFDKAADNNCYIVKGDKLMNPAKLMQNTNKETVGSKPFRAYMVDKSTAPAAGAKMFSIGFDNDGTTAIDNLNTIADDNAVYYDLQGKRLNAPQKGINIVKRGNKTMKVIIK